MTVLETQGLAARHAARALAVAGTARKNAALEAAARTIEARQGEILAANAADLEAAMAAGLRPALLDRLALDEGRIAGIVEGVRQVAALPDPIGAVTKMDTRPNGLTIGKRRVPLGVIGIIYEARPNVTVDAAALCLKSGNAALLRGGKEAFHSNQAFAAVLRDALEEAGLPRDCVALVADTSRESANELMGLTEYLDVLIPRGGAGLIRFVRENARIPVIETGAGIVHTYFDIDGDLEKGRAVVCNAKTRRVSVCNALDCLVIHRGRLTDLPELCAPLAGAHVTVYADEEAFAALDGHYPAGLLEHAAEEHFGTEFLDYKLAVKTVASLDGALAHIARYSSRHSEAIVTENKQAATQFTRSVDAACVYVNVSTAFTDGGQFGFGAEVGISTQKLHARGPMGLPELTTYKYIVSGDGQIRQP